jgi:Na+/H+-dicarboxylate symporter
MSRLFSMFILAGLVFGILVGWALHAYAPAADATLVADNLKIITDIFLRLIHMLVGPLVFSSLVSGIANVGAGAQVGRIGLRTILWFLGASITSLLLGMIMVNLLQPGAGLTLPPETSAPTGINAGALNFGEFLTHIFPRSFFEAMSGGDILQIVIFSVFVGLALGALGERTASLVVIAEQILEVMLKVTGYVMLLAPLAVFAAVTATIAKNGLEILLSYVKFVGGFYISLAILWGLIAVAGFLVLGKRIGQLFSEIRDPIVLAFSTASSEAAFPRIMEGLRRFGVPRRISGFVLPLGYSFNLDGSMMYCTFASLFIAQAYGVHLTLAQQVTMLALLMVTSKGMAGVPKASLVVIAATLAFFKIPETGILLILAVDQFLDMGRSATNVVGNAVASAVQAKWEGQLQEGPADETVIVVVTEAPASTS